MTFITDLSALKNMAKNDYKQSFKRDTNKISKAKGILIIDNYKFSNGRDTAVLLTDKAKKAKEAFKEAKEQGIATNKMARGTCKYTKDKNGKDLVNINILEGSLAMETIKAGCDEVFEKNNIKSAITNIPKTPEQEAAEEAAEEKEVQTDAPPVNNQEPQPQKSNDSEHKATSVLDELSSTLHEIEHYVKSGAMQLLDVVKKKERVPLEQFDALEEHCNLIRNWVGKFNKADKTTKDRIGTKHAVSMKENYVKLGHLRTAAFRLCPEAQDRLMEQETEENGSNNNNQEQPQNTNPTPKDDKKGDKGKDKDKDKNNNQKGDDKTPKEDQNQPDGDKNTDNNNENSNGSEEQPVATTTTTNTAPAKTISASVGSGGMNKKADVMTVQQLLNNVGYKLVVDGGCGPKTVNAIADFQKNKMGVAKPDGRIDPGGKTWTALSKNNTAPQPPATALDTSKINDTVGLGGKNRSDDVKVVQTLLQRAGYTIAIDGQCGGGTINTIKDFQKKKMKLLVADGLLTPGGPTFRAMLSGKMDDSVELRDKDQGKYDYTRIAFDLFSKGNADDHEIDETDVQQGQIGDCYFMSAIAAVAKNNPESIKKLITAKSDGSYDVKLYAKSGKLALEPTIINVKPDFVTDKNGNLIYADAGDKEIWVMLLEKAYAKMMGGYDDIGEGGFIEAGLEAITGTDSKVYMLVSYTTKQISEVITQAIADKKPITAASEGSGEQEFTTEAGNVIYKGHAYSIEKLTGDKLFLRNPWGHSHATLSLTEFKKYFNHFVV